MSHHLERTACEKRGPSPGNTRIHGWNDDPYFGFISVAVNKTPLKTQHSRGSCLTCNSSFIAHPFGRVKVKTEVACHITSLVKNRRINSPLPDCLLLTSFLSYLGCCLGSRATHNRLVGEDRGRWRSPQVNIMETWGGSISLEEGTGDNVICHEMTLWVQCQGGFGYIVSHWGHGLWFEVNEAFSLGSKA